MQRFVVLLLLVALAGCAMLVPTDFKKSEAGDAAVLTELVERHDLGTIGSDVEAWERIREVSQNMVLRNIWLRGESVDWTNTQKAEAPK